MHDLTARMILTGQPRDPRECSNEAEIEQAFAEMSVEAREYDRHVDSLRGGVPRVIADLHQTIAHNELERLRRLGGV
jgi:hypothetical protein